MYKQLTIYVNDESVEILTDLFFDFGALATTICDANEGNADEELIFDEPVGLLSVKQVPVWKHSILYVLFLQEDDINPIILEIYSILGMQFEYTESILEDQNWVELSQQQHEIIHITDDFVIASEWHRVPQGCKAVMLNPGLAFGSGTHPTTRMCLEWLVANPPIGENVLDFGCGSGILAITAAVCGATEVVGVDIDQQAILSSQYNAELNSICASFMLPEQLDKDRRFDVVLANILANPLKELAPLLRNYTAQHLLLSGILEQQADEVIEVYKQYFTKVEQKNTNGWSILWFQL